jgi:uncharacterized protein YbjT (DUF2867 family)
VAVVGASGLVGRATLSSLEVFSSLPIKVKAISRDPSKLPGLSSHVEAVAGDFADGAGLATALKGVSIALLVTPGAQDRTQLMVNAIQAAKEAGVRTLVIISVPSVAKPESIFGSQMLPIEQAAFSSGIRTVVLRCPLFFENQLGNIQSITTQGTIYGPGEPDRPFAAVAVQDIGRVAAAILVDPTPHHGQSESAEVQPVA